MNDETPFVDEASLLVASLKQNALMKIVETLTRRDLEKFCFINSSVGKKHLQRFSDKIEQLGIPKSCQDDICSAISGLYHQICNGAIHFAHSPTLSDVRFNVRGDVEVHRTFDACMKNICRWPHTPRNFLFIFLKDACLYHQEQCVHRMLCELAEWKKSELVASLRNARPEVEVVKFSKWHFNIRFVIEDLVDPAPWKSFVTMLNNNVGVGWIRFFLRENIIYVSMEEIPSLFTVLLWPKLSTIEKYAHAAEFFKAALDESDTCLLVQTLHYLDSTDTVHLIKTNLARFLLCFLTHPYYKRFLPDLQLDEEDLHLVQEENELLVIEQVLRSLYAVGDYTNISDSLIELWRYVSSRDKSLGDHVHRNIKAFVNDNSYHRWQRNSSSDAEIAFAKLYEIFPTEQ